MLVRTKCPASSQLSIYTLQSHEQQNAVCIHLKFYFIHSLWSSKRIKKIVVASHTWRRLKHLKIKKGGKSKKQNSSKKGDPSLCLLPPPKYISCLHNSNTRFFSAFINISFTVLSLYQCLVFCYTSYLRFLNSLDFLFSPILISS